MAAAGLTTERAAELLRRAGPNVLPGEKPVPQWRKLWAELTHFFALMLWVAAALAFVADMPQLGVAIIVVVIVNGVFAHIQQERAQHAAARLRGLLPADVRVRRDGQVRTVHASDLVIDDAVLLTAGDRVPADVILLTAAACAVDESMLTGESVPVPKTGGDPAWGGTFLVNGDAEATVTATGASTRLAGIAALTSAAVPPPTPLSLELRRIVRLVVLVALGIACLFFLVSLVAGIAWRDSFLFAIGVAVALVPEGLLPTVTLSLAMGAQRMAARNALVRNLEAVETLGSTTFICTDKTGTLTQNRMNAVKVHTPAGTIQVAGEGYGPAGAVQGDGQEAAAEAALAARAASQGRATASGRLPATRWRQRSMRWRSGSRAARCPGRRPRDGSRLTPYDAGSRPLWARTCSARAHRKRCCRYARASPQAPPARSGRWRPAACGSLRWRGGTWPAWPVTR
ncbi:ATPase, P-type (transporting), HAD superfamily, subfamily IC [Pseudarthrobacter chlorophenolicus]|nr:ATPase, P-type (transporting), HAD superfamily, subfamily IC [Pseudarthrobacter chlorophenolicus]